MNSSIAIINDEFEYQQDKYGSLDHFHIEHELAWAALAYIRMYLAETEGDKHVAKGYYPFVDDRPWNPETSRRSLVKAGAFIASELERLNATVG